MDVSHEGGVEVLAEFGDEFGVGDLPEDKAHGEATALAALVLDLGEALEEWPADRFHVKVAARAGVRGGDDPSGIPVLGRLGVGVLDDGWHGQLGKEGIGERAGKPVRCVGRLSLGDGRLGSFSWKCMWCGWTAQGQKDALWR